MKYIVLALIGAFMGGSIVYIIMIGKRIDRTIYRIPKPKAIKKRELFDELPDINEKIQR